MRTIHHVTLATFLLVGSLAGCSGDDDAGAPEATPTGEVAPSLEDAASLGTSSAVTDNGGDPTSPPAATVQTEATPDAGTTDAGTSAVTDCPDAGAVSRAYGAEVEFNEADAMTGAIGLVFCPYDEVLAPGTTDAFGGDPIPNSFSITITNQNVIDPEIGTPLDGVGQAATWSDVVGELAVWTGEIGILVSLTFPPPGDVQATAIAIAELMM